MVGEGEGVGFLYAGDVDIGEVAIIGLDEIDDVDIGVVLMSMSGMSSESKSILISLSGVFCSMLLMSLES